MKTGAEKCSGNTIGCDVVGVAWWCFVHDGNIFILKERLYASVSVVCMEKIPFKSIKLAKKV